MQVEEVAISEVRKKIIVDLPEDVVRKQYDEIETKVIKLALIPGFRKGRVPREVVRRMYKEAIQQESTEALVRSTLESLFQERDIHPIGSPQVTKLDGEYARPLHFEIEFEVMPPLKVENYKGITLKRAIIPVTDEDVNAKLLELQRMAAEYKPVDEPAGERHWAILDLAARFADTGESVLDQKGMLFALGSDSPEPRIAAQLIGAKAGEEREFSIEFGEGDQPAQFVGKTIRYKASVREIKEQILPTLDDEFATTLGDYSSLDELSEKVRRDVSTEKEELVKRNYANQLMDYLATAYPLEVPSAFYQEYALQNTIAYKQYLERIGKQTENLEEEMEKAFVHFANEAAKFTRVSLVLEEISRLESIKVTDGDVDERIRRMAEEGHKSFDGLKAKLGEKGRTQIRSNLLKDKAIDFLVAEATIE